MSTSTANIIEQLRPLARPIGELQLDPANARTHGPKNLDAIKASLTRYGQRKPIVVRAADMIVEAGNGTLEAAKALGWSEIAAVIVDDDPTTATGYAIADNRTAELAEWDDDALSKLLESVAEEIPLDSLGFDTDDLAELLGADPEDPAEDPGADEPPAEPVSQRGEVYALGPHRLMCGDSTSAEDVAALLGGCRGGSVVTDPPYGIAYKSNHKNTDGTPNVHKKLAGDECANPKFAWAISQFSAPGAGVLIGTRWDVLQDWIDNLSLVGLKVKSTIAWVKSIHGMGDLRGEFGRKWEAVLFAHDGGFAFPSKRPVDVWDIGGLFTRGHRNHPTEKPTTWAERGMSDIEAGDLVCDPFLGGGTTLIAAARTGRRCYGMEISPAYCDVIRKRWGDYARGAGIDPGPDAL